MGTSKSAMTKPTPSSREKILEAARVLLREANGQDLRLRDVAELAGVSMGSITHHFSSKSALLDACLDDHYARIEALGVSLESLSALTDLTTLVSHGARLVYRFYRGEYDSLRLRAATGAADNKLLAERLQETLVPTRENVARMLVQFAGITQVKARLIVQSITYLSTAYVLCDDEQFEKSTPPGTPRSAIEEHIVDVALSLTTQNMSAT